MAVQIIIGDCREVLKTIPDGTVHCVVTSPPFWGLRDYGLPPLIWGGDPECEHVWGPEQAIHQRGKVGDHSTLEGGLQAGGDGRLQKATQDQWCQHCGAWQGSLGLEPTPELYVEHLVGIFRQVRRVLRDDGTGWLNLGDSYAGSWGNYAPGGIKGVQRPQTEDGQRWKRNAYEDTTFLPPTASAPGLKPKDLVGVPWRVAFALQADGWWLRSDIIWEKPNCMPEGVKDRPTTSHEYVFLLAKSARYFYDADAIREPNESGPSDIKKMVEQKERIGGKHKVLIDPLSKASDATNIGQKRAVGDPTTGRNRRTVWTIATCPFPGAHFATFPPALVEPCIKAGTSERGCCPECGAPWERVVERVFVPQDDVSLDKGIRGAMNQKRLDASNTWEGYPRGTTQTTTTGWRPTCSCYPIPRWNGIPFEDGDWETINTPTGERTGDDPTMHTGRAEYNRPRSPNEGMRPITQYEQKCYARQLCNSPYRAQMEEQAGTAFEHYIRTDKSGARPIPPNLLNQWIEYGWLEQVEIPTIDNIDSWEATPAVVLDPFGGAGTTGLVADQLGRDCILIDLKAEYGEMARRRILSDLGPMFTQVEVECYT